MAKILPDVSRTFSEYLLIPRLSPKGLSTDQIDLSTPLAACTRGDNARMRINIPMVSACMQSVSGPDLAISLAREGGMAFIFCSQPIESQAAMVRQVKQHKAGFVESDSNIRPDASLGELIQLMRQTGHSTVPVTEDGSPTGRFLGLITDNDFWEHGDDLAEAVRSYMTPADKVFAGQDGMTLRQANAELRKHKKECLPILNSRNHLVSLVFKKDYVDHHRYPLELLDTSKRLMVGAGINTHDYRERVPALVEAGVDALVFDSSDGFSEYQREGLEWIRDNCSQDLVVGAGNVVSAEGFDYLVERNLADFVKVGMGGGSICITREQKGTGRGQASALLDVAEARDRHYQKTGWYVPICSDGGLTNDTQLIIALAMGADFVMTGRYFAMTEESPTPKTTIRGQMYKPYWGEGSRRAQNWQRYGDEALDLKFEEGVDAYVPLMGKVSEVLETTLFKLRSTMVNIGSESLEAFRQQAVLTLVSEQSVVEAGTSSVFKFNNSWDYEDRD